MLLETSAQLVLSFVDVIYPLAHMHTVSTVMLYGMCMCFPMWFPHAENLMERHWLFVSLLTLRCVSFNLYLLALGLNLRVCVSGVIWFAK